MHTITRDTSEEAWAEADRLLAGVDDDAIAKVQAGLRKSESEGQRRMLDLNGGSRDDLEIYPNVWAGVGLVRGGAGTALVGSHEEVADRIEEYHSVGIDEFVLSAYPHLEGAYWFGEGVLPVLARRGLWKHPHPTAINAPGPVRGRGPEGRVVTARVAVVVGNPKPGSRTLAAAVHVARELTGAEPDLVVDLADLGAALLDWQDPGGRGPRRAGGGGRPRGRGVPDLQGRPTPGCSSSSWTASPPTGCAAWPCPLMLGAGPAHALAPELTLRPVLTEIGGLVPAPGALRRGRGVRRPDRLRALARARPTRHHLAILDSLTGATS